MREPTVVATTMAITVATALATSRVWTAISISPDLTVSKLLKSETYRYPDDADRLRRLLIEAGPRASQYRRGAMSAIGPKQTSLVAPHMSAFGVKRTWKALQHLRQLRTCERVIVELPNACESGLTSEEARTA